VLVNQEHRKIAIDVQQAAKNGSHGFAVIFYSKLLKQKIFNKDENYQRAIANIHTRRHL